MILGFLKPIEWLHVFINILIAVLVSFLFLNLSPYSDLIMELVKNEHIAIVSSFYLNLFLISLLLYIFQFKQGLVKAIKYTLITIVMISIMFLVMIVLFYLFAITYDKVMDYIVNHLL